MGLSCFKSWKHESSGHKGNRDVLASPGSYFFLSNSAGQGDEWLKSLNKGVWIPFTGVFGQRLEETVLYERRYGVRLVPLVVEQCVNFIRECGLHEVGLFRQPGQASLVKELQEAFDSGERPSFDSNTDVHTVASLLKLYLRQLPEPLVPYSRYQDFLICSQKLLSDRMLGLGDLRKLLHELPVANFNLLSFICQFLNEVQSYSGSNRMSVQNLATVFGPNILRAKAEDPQSIMGGAALVQVLMLELIREHESLFSKIPPSIFIRPSGGRNASPAALQPPCLRQLSLPLIAERWGEPAPAENASSSAAARSDFVQKRLLGHRYTSSHPENCFYPSPCSIQPVQNRSDRTSVDHHQQHAGRGASPGGASPGGASPGGASPGGASLVAASTSSLQLQDPLPDGSRPRLRLLGWAQAWPGPEEAAAFWRPRGAEGEEGAVPEAASGGSSPSAYDNLDRASPRQDGGHLEAPSPGHVGEEEVEEARQRRDSSSSWSSCEVLPLDDVGAVSPGLVPPRSKSLPTSRVTEEESSGKDDEEDDDVHHPNSPASGSVLSDSPLSTGSSEVFLPSGPPDLQDPEDHQQPSDAHSLLAELRQQMAQQRAEYQARIQRLERCNDVLQRQVAVLRVRLEQQKRSRSVAEIKIRNMERAKADADRRNSTLQREMEMFFQMYGDFRRGGTKERTGSI